jgi:hypothetical protein
VRIVTTSAYTLEEAFPGLPWLAITKALDVLVDELGAEDVTGSKGHRGAPVLHSMAPLWVA